LTTHIYTDRQTDTYTISSTSCKPVAELKIMKSVVWDKYTNPLVAQCSCGQGSHNPTSYQSNNTWRVWL